MYLVQQIAKKKIILYLCGYKLKLHLAYEKAKEIILKPFQYSVVSLLVDIKIFLKYL